MHRSTGFERCTVERQEEQENGEVLTVMSYQCTEKLVLKEVGRKAVNQVLLLHWLETEIMCFLAGMPKYFLQMFIKHINPLLLMASEE